MSSGIDSVSAGQRIGHRNDLALIRRIGQHFLIPGHAGIEDHLSQRPAMAAERVSSKNGPVLEQKNCLGTIPRKVHKMFLTFSNVTNFVSAQKIMFQSTSGICRGYRKTLKNNQL